MHILVASTDMTACKRITAVLGRKARVTCARFAVEVIAWLENGPEAAAVVTAPNLLGAESGVELLMMIQKRWPKVKRVFLCDIPAEEIGVPEGVVDVTLHPEAAAAEMRATLLWLPPKKASNGA